jgi:hypothetical protein
MDAFADDSHNQRAYMPDALRNHGPEFGKLRPPASSAAGSAAPRMLQRENSLLIGILEAFRRAKHTVKSRQRHRRQSPHPSGMSGNSDQVSLGAGKSLPRCLNRPLEAGTVVHIKPIGPILRPSATFF